MGKAAFFTALKADLQTISYIRENGSSDNIKFVSIYKNVSEDMDNPNLMPAVLIEFMPHDFRELTNAVQDYDLQVRLHVEFESYKDEDIDVLNCVEAVYAKVAHKQYAGFSKMIRISEETDNEMTNKQVYKMIFKTHAKDFSADNRPATPVTVTPSINPTIIKIEDNL
jgi:hypothetical protein